MNDSSTPTRRPPPKRTLFCPECDHAATTGGDWIVETRPGGEALRCPDCGATVTVRPASRAIPA
ncbi:hypothetical protein Hbl1158_00295 [Halobaculum sp. CBA1158]|uniref:hypothetical protein n=1 Tax=Halobaculum sp. CBA1158 TaxID=2904243 RepID=UPI001F37170C|nr:hypothetical protein [Halobaculum sp. CBA1158]UIO99849.1 hypothetical protein Hbl1158_00295 [Halobaculum sp. CBA1158]